MPTLIHITDEKNSSKILKSGIKLPKHGKGIFFMPITQDFFGSHQWIRELKRRGVKTMIGVHFKLKSSEMVWYGRYNHQHKFGPLGEAIKAFLDAEDRQGYEFLIERKITADEIHKIRSVPQKVGWRYFPGSHERPLNCACPICIGKGEINARKKINKIEPPEPILGYPDLLERLQSEDDEYEVENLFSSIRMKKRKSDPEALRFIIDRDDNDQTQSLAISLSSFKHPNAIKMLVELCAHPDDDVREYSAEGILEINSQKGAELLKPFGADPVICRVLNEHGL